MVECFFAGPLGPLFSAFSRSPEQENGRLPLACFSHQKAMYSDCHFPEYELRSPADPQPFPVQEPPDPPENPDMPVREPEPEVPNQI